MRVVTERENKFEVDADWVLPQLADLRAGWRPSRSCRAQARQYLFRHTKCWSAVVWDHAATSGGGLRDRLAVEGSQRHGSYGTAERLANEDAAARGGGSAWRVCWPVRALTPSQRS